jgi:phage-related protein
MAIGFTDLTSTVRRPDKMMSASSTPKILKTNFGDGYEQRLAAGINNLEQDYSVGFSNRTKEEIDDIIAFFVSKGGVTNFTFTIPDSNNSGETAIKVVCDTWSQSYSYGDYYGCQATFRRVYES